MQFLFVISYVVNFIFEPACQFCLYLYRVGVKVCINRSEPLKLFYEYFSFVNYDIIRPTLRQLE